MIVRRGNKEKEKLWQDFLDWQEGFRAMKKQCLIDCDIEDSDFNENAHDTPDFISQNHLSEQTPHSKEV